MLSGGPGLLDPLPNVTLTVELQGMVMGSWQCADQKKKKPENENRAGITRPLRIIDQFIRSPECVKGYIAFYTIKIVKFMIFLADSRPLSLVLRLRGVQFLILFMPFCIPYVLLLKIL